MLADTMNQPLTVNDIQATSDRMANGWAAVLVFPSGGRQRFSSRHGTQDGANREAQHARRARVNYPDATVSDPQANSLQDFANGRPS